MNENDVLVLDRRGSAASEIRSSLKDWDFGTVEFQSVSDALAAAPWPRLSAVIADVRALTEQHAPRQATEAELSASIMRLREASHRTRSSARPLVVIVMSARDGVAEHAAAVKAGADLYLSHRVVTNTEIIGIYLSRMLQRRADDVPAAPEANPVQAQAPSGWMEVFDLPAARVRGENGRLDASRIAHALGVPLKKLAAAIGTGYTTVHKTPDSPALQAVLAPFANVVAMLDEVFGGDEQRVLAWLQVPRERLGNRTPQQAMLAPGGAAGVEQFVAGAWMGEPD
jgi:CheY-like chemotaxis protein